MIKSCGDLIQGQWKLKMAVPPKMPHQNKQNQNQTSKNTNEQQQQQNHGGKYISSNVKTEN